jgi:hypothetical protein
VDFDSDSDLGVIPDEIAMTPEAIELRSRMTREWAERVAGGASQLGWTERQHFRDVDALLGCITEARTDLREMVTQIGVQANARKEADEQRDILRKEVIRLTVLSDDLVIERDAARDYADQLSAEASRLRERLGLDLRPEEWELHADTLGRAYEFETPVGPVGDFIGWLAYRRESERAHTRIARGARDQAIAELEQLTAKLVDAHNEGRQAAADAIVAHADKIAPVGGNSVQQRMRRHLNIAIQVASPPITMEQVAQAIRDGHFAACYHDAAGQSIPPTSPVTEEGTNEAADRAAIADGIHRGMAEQVRRDLLAEFAPGTEEAATDGI